MHMEHIGICRVFLLIAQLYWLFLFMMVCCVYPYSSKQIICLKYDLHTKKPNKKWRLQKQEGSS